ncbi:MAG: hypothetical protein BroJett005_08340 [Ignavibacteriota bacterium]|nr:MAG: hypothetical protein BroJett005_08340 [Ignavibacteriota bacterium]
MSKIEKLVKDYSSQKLKEIIGQQSSSYSETFIDYAKDELIRRGESFQFNPELEKEVAAMSDNDLKNLVEKEWDNFHLEYLEIARKEYMKRKFINESSDEEPEQQEETDTAKRYPALRTIAGIYSVFAWIIGIVAVIIAFISWSKGGETGGLMIAIPTLVVGALIVLGLLAASESIKVFIDIEENTRKTNE